VLGLVLGLDLVSGWLVVMLTYLYYFLLSLSLSPYHWRNWPRRSHPKSVGDNYYNLK